VGRESGKEKRDVRKKLLGGKKHKNVWASASKSFRAKARVLVLNIFSHYSKIVAIERLPLLTIARVFSLQNNP